MTQWNEPPRDARGEQYAQPQYAQQPPPYGQPPPVQAQPGQPLYDQYGRPVTGFSARLEQSESFGIAGTVMTLLGGIVVLVSFTALEWFSDGFSDGAGATFSQVHGGLGPNANGFAVAYFGWLGWVFLVVTVIAGVLAAVPSPALRIFRIIGIVVGVAAAGLTFLAINFGTLVPYTDALKHARVGFYLAVLGFLIAGIGAGLGPRKGAVVR